MFKGCVDEVSCPPYCCNPLTVAEGRKLRLVIDLRHVNEYVTLRKFKYKDLRIVSTLFEKDYFFSTFDLESGYHHVDIFPPHRKYLGFSWRFPNGQIRYFQFNVLPFGLSSTCYAFTKLLRPLVKRWRGFGYSSVVYLDDGITGRRSFDLALRASNQVRQDLKDCGLTANEQKCTWFPLQIGEWLGMIINTISMTFVMPQKKIDKLSSSVNSILSRPHFLVTAKELARIAGQIISMGLALGPVSRLMTRNMYKCVAERQTWFHLFHLDEQTASELVFWRDNMRKYNGYSMKSSPTVTRIVYSDASDTGYGGFLVERLGKKLASGNFSQALHNTSSTQRELATVKFVLDSFGPSLNHQRVK